MHTDMAGGSPAFERIRLIHIAFMGAVAVYALLAVQMSVVIEDPDTPLAGTPLWLLRVGLVTLAVAGQATVAYVLNRPHRSRQQQRIAEGDESALVAAANARVILRLAFTEAIGIYGLLLFLVGGEIFDVLGFCAAAFVILAVRFPTRDAWSRELERLRCDAARQ